MKKRLFLLTAMIACLVCLFAISVSAETVLKPQADENYGEISLFDEELTVGRTDRDNGFTPFLADGVSYARVVIGDGTTFYTFPTYYIMQKNGEVWQYNFASLNSAMEATTQTNPNWGVTNVYRLEVPESVKYITGNSSQKFEGFINMIELRLATNMSTLADNSTCLFRYNDNLEVIHNIDTFVFRKGCLTDAFNRCKKLTSLTLCVSPNVIATGVNTFRECYALESVNFNEAFPNNKEFGNYAFYKCNSLKTISSSRNDGVVEFSSKITYYGQYAFQDCDSIKAIKFTSSTQSMMQQAFHSLGSLEYIYFPRNTELKLPACEVFSNNEKLKAVAFPDSCTLIPDRGFKNCKALKAVYLPSNLYELRTNGGDQGAFSSCYELYFVNEWFSVIDENGEFLLESFEMPSRPDIYYFPSTLTLFYKKDSGTGFYKNYKLNPVMVLPENVTELWVYDGCFYDCGERGDTFTVICLGDMVNIRISFRENRAKGINYVLANPDDIDLSSVNVIDTTPDRTPSLNGDEFISFCASNKHFVLFNLGGTNDSKQYTNDNVTWVNESKHLTEPKKGITVVDPTCTTNEATVSFCFCGFEIRTEKENTALGHEFDISNGASIEGINYNGNYYGLGIYTFGCARCQEQLTEETGSAQALFGADLGYSFFAHANGTFSMAQGFNINAEAIKSYKAIYADFDFGALYCGNSKTHEDATEISPLVLTDGIASFNGKKGEIRSLVSEEGYKTFNVKVNNITAASSGYVVVFGAYIVDGGEIYYLENGICAKTVYGKSYTDVNPDYIAE